MELNIPDLLDHLQDESVTIQPCTQSSPERIKELTMKKVHKYERPRGKGLPLFRKFWWRQSSLPPWPFPLWRPPALS